MRFHSTPESVVAGDATVLAMLETAAAMAGSLWLAYHRLSLQHIAIAACLAPFLLLRTPEAVDLAARWARSSADFGSKILDRVTASSRPALIKSFIIPLFLMLAFAAALSCIRIAAVLIMALRFPARALKSLPQNWARVTLAMDVFQPPEFMPGAENHPEFRGSLKELRFRDYLELFDMSGVPLAGQAVLGVHFVLLGALLFLPSLLYRFSLKSTCLVYLPLLSIVGDHGNEDARSQLRMLLRSQIERLKRWYSSFVLLCLNVIPTLVYFVWHTWWRSIVDWVEFAMPRTAIRLSAIFLFTMPDGIELDGWHIARSVNALITLGLWLFAKERIAMLGNADSGPRLKSIEFCLTVRRTLTVYILLCTVYLIATRVDWSAITPVHVRWFPW